MMRPGSVLPIHLVHCLDCSAMLARKTYWRKPRCAKCRQKRKVRACAQTQKEMRRQARRYRIVLHVLGWEDSQFEEMLSEMRHCPMTFRRDPEGRSARFDLALERRSHRRTAKVGPVAREGKGARA